MSAKGLVVKPGVKPSGVCRICRRGFALDDRVVRTVPGEMLHERCVTTE